MDIGQLFLTQVIIYSVAVLIAALTLAIVLDLFGLRRMPAELRGYVYRTFLVGLLGLVLAFVTGLLKTPDQIAATVRGAVDREVDRKVELEVVDSIEDNIRLSNERAAAIRPKELPPEQPPPPVAPMATLYIQASNIEQKNGASGLLAALEAAGVKTPGVEIVGTRSPPQAEVRYFNDVDKASAERIAGVARTNGFADVVVKTIPSYKSPPGQLEFWYPRAAE